MSTSRINHEARFAPGIKAVVVIGLLSLLFGAITLWVAYDNSWWHSDTDTNHMGAWLLSALVFGGTLMILDGFERAFSRGKSRRTRKRYKPMRPAGSARTSRY